jgi:hypothetical protein
VSKAPSMMSQWRIPSSKDSAGNTEYLEWKLVRSNYTSSKLVLTHLLPRQKKAFLVAFQPHKAQARPR